MRLPYLPLAVLRGLLSGIQTSRQDWARDGKSDPVISVASGGAGPTRILAFSGNNVNIVSMKY